MATIQYKTGEKILIVLIFVSLIFYPHCSGNRIERITSLPSEIKNIQQSKEFPFLKLHMKNGDVYVLENWKVDNKEKSVNGNGISLDFNRQPRDNGEYKIPFEDIVLAETNHISGSAGTGVLAAATIITGIFTIICIANPKACFGSCPTFYTNDGNGFIVQAEGFSSSISPSLEENDIDALFMTKPGNKNLEVQLRNEAYETHVIRKANILALPREKGNRVFASQEEKFYEVKNLTEVSEAVGDEGDISEMLCTFDGIERFSTADSFNLSEKEIIEVSFKNISPGKKGLVVASRQTLLTTFLFYQGLAYMGTSAGYFLANLERNNDEVKKLLDNPRKELGNIEILAEKENGVWEKIGETGEHGPISTDIKIIPLQNNNSKSHINLRLKITKGLWRLDYLALADIVKEVKPIIVPPSGSFPELTKEKSNIVKLLTNPDSVLITFPGDKYFLNYQLPDDYESYELFMESQGYYLEWMREEWLAEENPLKVYQMFYNPKQFFKDIAPQFKKIEAEMEETFWSSKYVNP
ncbi:MAG: hypothetical protein EHM47_03360 [Ignavibacteriales bacterium]|nr:MAG: hypothetical protein EHM47_03360 [Ignavibacteriales bacterium]